MLIIKATSFYVKMSNDVDFYSVFKTFARFSKLLGPISISIRYDRFYLSKFDKFLFIVRSLLSLLCLYVKAQEIVQLYFLKPYLAFVYIESQLCVFFLIICYTILEIKVNYYIDLVNDIINLCKKMEAMKVKLNFKMIGIFYKSVLFFLHIFFLSSIVDTCLKISFTFQDIGNLCSNLFIPTYMCFECNIALFIGLVTNISKGLKERCNEINQFKSSKSLKSTDDALYKIFNIVKNMNKIFVYLIFRLTLLYVYTSFLLCNLLTADTIQLIMTTIIFILIYCSSLFPILFLCVSVKNEVCM